MSRVVKINITESAETLETLLNRQKAAIELDQGSHWDIKEGTLEFDRVQALYLLKTQQVATVQQLAVVLGRDRTTVHRWLRRYRCGGLTEMLKVRKGPGKASLIPKWAVQRLQEELKDPEGFSSYGEIKLWLETTLGIKVKYDVVHNLVHDKLRTQLKKRGWNQRNRG